jgi:hypothetical protein
LNIIQLIGYVAATVIIWAGPEATSNTVYAGAIFTLERLLNLS